MHKPLFRIAVGSVAAVGGLIVASALPAGAATSVRAEMADTCPVPTASPNGTPCSTPDDTVVTFSVTSTGVLAITAPVGTIGTPIDLGGGASAGGVVGGTIGIAGDFGPVTVTDYRDYDPAAWTATVSSTDFANLATSRDVIPAADAKYAIPGLSADNGTGGSGLPFPTALTGLANVAGTGGIQLANVPTVTPPIGQTIVTLTDYAGDNAVTWSPTITVAVPANTPTGTYEGTITHSVT